MERLPPFLPRWLLTARLPRVEREFIIGDLDEEFDVIARGSVRRARRWYWSQALRSVLEFQHPARQPQSKYDVRYTRARLPGALMDNIARDIRYAVRNLIRSPGFAAAAILTLALGIGATTAIFSAVNDVVLRPLSFPNSHELMMLWESNEERGWYQVHAAPANAMDWRDRVDAFSDIAMLSEFSSTVALTGNNEPRSIDIGQVGSNVFDVLGAPPVHGRSFTEEELWSDAEPVVILSHTLWTNHFGGSIELIGNTVMLDGESYRVIGVMGPNFQYPFAEVDAWRTFRWTPSRRESIWFRQAHVVRAVGRLAPGASQELARSQLAAVALQLEQEHPALNQAMRADLTPLRVFLLGDQGTPLFLLMGTVVVLLAVACANVANLFLSKMLHRNRELAVRTALGATRQRLLMQMFTESLVIASAGSMVGIGVGIGIFSTLTALRPPELPAFELHLDWRMLLFSTLLTVVSALLFGMLPAMSGTRHTLAQSITSHSRASSGNRSMVRASSIIAAGQIALAVVLVMASALMARTMVNLKSIPLHFDSDNVLTFAISPPRGTYTTDQQRVRYAVLVQQALQTIPGVTSVGITRQFPLGGGGWTSNFAIENEQPLETGDEVSHREITRGYFEALRIPLLAGELPTALQDVTSLEMVLTVVVNRAFAERYFPTSSPVGRRIAFDRVPTENSYWYTIVGVVEDQRTRLASVPGPEILGQLPADVPQTLRFALRSPRPPMTLVPEAREAVRSVDASIPINEIQTMNDIVGSSMARERFLLVGIGVFGVVALVLASVGVYGVMSESTRRRSKEIGIRIALGATQANLVSQIVLASLRLSAVGLGVGLIGAALGSRFMSGVLYQVAPLDPIAFVSVPILLGIAAMVAAYVPARRAGRLNPVETLRSD